MTVNIFDETGNLSADIEEIIVSAAKMCAAHEELGKNSSVDILITDKDSIKDINRDKRGIDSATDVLSFPMAQSGEFSLTTGQGLFLGDIVICLEKIFEQAEEYGHSADREAGFLTAHGMLHLMGYDHMNEADEKEMFAKQEIILTKLGLKR